MVCIEVDIIHDKSRCVQAVNSSLQAAAAVGPAMTFFVSTTKRDIAECTLAYLKSLQLAARFFPCVGAQLVCGLDVSQIDLVAILKCNLDHRLRLRPVINPKRSTSPTKHGERGAICTHQALSPAHRLCKS